MQWTVLADVLRAVAAGLTAVIATLKFIYDIRQRRNIADEVVENSDLETGETADPNQPTPPQN